jgi:hypothetical protein
LSVETDTSTPASAPQPPTENQASPVPSEISSLASYMARQRDSSARPTEQPKAGEGTPPQAPTPPQDQREQFIPRQRFDEVLTERNQLRQQVQQQYAPPPPPPQPMGYQPPPGMTRTGMVGMQPQQQPSALDLSNPAVKAEWHKKIVNDPVSGLGEFIEQMLMARGQPMLEQFHQQIVSQLAPIQQSYVQQQLSSYQSQRSQADPSFGQVAPVFNQLVTQAVQRGYAMTPQVLQAIEGIARAQAGMLSAPPPPKQVPFTETPGAQGLGQSAPPPPTLTPQEQMVAQRFGMTADEYAAYKRSYS